MGNTNVTLYIYGVNIYEKKFYQVYNIIIAFYCVRIMTSFSELCRFHAVISINYLLWKLNSGIFTIYVIINLQWQIL